jgi:hypothetical protein
MAMYREVERGFGVFDPIVRVFTGGFQLPVLTVLSRMTQYAEYTGAGVSPLPILALAAATLYGIWAFPSASGRSSSERAATVGH